jgi:hypothetical protein
MKKLRCSSSVPLNKKIACTVSAAALMLGVSSAATVGLHFQDNYCASAPYTGFVVTLPAFGIGTNGWENLAQMDTGYSCTPDTLTYTLNEVISTTTTTNGLNPLPNGSLNVTWTAATANFDPFAGYAGTPPNYYTIGGKPGAFDDATNPISGESQVYATFLRDGLNFGPGESGGNNTEPVYLIDITGLKSLFTNSPFVVELMASADSMQTLTNALVIDVTNKLTNTVSYPSTPPVTVDQGGAPWLRGIGGGLSTVSGALNTDHMQITSVQPAHGGDKTDGYDQAGTISGFIITDKPVVSMSPQTIPVAGPGDSLVLSAYAIGVPPLSLQWRLNGENIPHATNLSYAISNVNLSSGGSFDLVVTNLYGAATSKVSTVTVDLLTQVMASNLVFDSNPSFAQHDGVDMGATWAGSNSDGTITRSGVMSFVAADTNGITVADAPGFDGPTGTVSFWMRASNNNNAGSGASIICRATGTAGQDFIIYQAGGAPGSLDVQGPTGSFSFASAGAVGDDKWHFVAVTFDQSASGGAALYIDGAQDSTNANSAAWSWTAGQPLEIGYSSDPTWTAYNGLLSDVRFYNTVLSSTRIAAIYHNTADENELVMQLNFAAAPENGFTLSWQEKSAFLESAPSLQGPWTDVLQATSPYTIVPAASQQYFRYRYKPQSLASNPYLM